MSQRVYFTKDSRGKVYVVSQKRECFTIETAHKKWPELIGMKTAQAVVELDKALVKHVVPVELNIVKTI